jgi:hypothetical protein
MFIIHFINWCRVQLFGQPRRQRPQDQTVLAWRLDGGFIHFDRRS